MNQETEHVRIPSEFFAKTLKEYQDWRFAWFRETAQNAADAGATRIDFGVQQTDSGLLLSVRDNGSGMDEETLRRGLLTLGGSVKATQSEAIGGYGYAKHIILFAHHAYRLHTRDLDLSGEAGCFVVQPSGRWTEGTRIEVTVADQGLEEPLCDACRTLIHHFETDIRLTLNGKRITPRQIQYDYPMQTALGLLQFSEHDSSEVSFWVRMRGLPMFPYRVWNAGERGFEGVLDLTGAPTELLTTNRDGLNHQARRQLDDLLMGLIQQRQRFKVRNQLNLTFNSTQRVGAMLTPPDLPADALAAHPFQAIERALQQKLEQALQQLSHLQPQRYPENFHIHITDVVLRRERDRIDQVSIPQVRRLLELQRAKKLAWVWTLAVQWVLETDYLVEEAGVEVDEQTTRYFATFEGRSRQPVDTGFVFDGELLGLNQQRDDRVMVLLNPLLLPRDWLIGDLLDIAIHECSHLLVSAHGELFIEVEHQIRKAFRRLIGERQVLKDAREAMHEVGLR